MNTDIFKLIFLHDQRLNKLVDNSAPENPKKMESSLEDFMTPDPTYSRFYFSGTDLPDKRFGLNTLSAYEDVIDAFDSAFQEYKIWTQDSEFSSLKEVIGSLEIGETIVLTRQNNIQSDISDLHIKATANDNGHKESLKKAIKSGHIIIYKIRAKDGFDLQMFSKKNVYRDMFFPLQKLVPDHFRFFSINGKKFNTERHFYFETWTLDRPPHGFEEVFPETVL